MKIEFYSIGDEEGKLIKRFLENNKLPFKEINIGDIRILEKIAQTKLQRKISLLKIRYSSSIGVIIGFNETALNHLLKHIEEYNLKTK